MGARGHDRALPQAAVTDSAARALPRLCESIIRILRRQRTRRALARLDDRLLRDIGVTRDAAAREAARPFWKA